MLKPSKFSLVEFQPTYKSIREEHLDFGVLVVSPELDA